MVLLIVVCSLASWSVHWREVGTRLGIDITLLLVAVACKQDLASATADISYDWPILCPIPWPNSLPSPGQPVLVLRISWMAPSGLLDVAGTSRLSIDTQCTRSST